MSSTGQRRPPNYSLDDMPITSFSCRDRTIGGYYADPEADCQMFHVCVKMADNDVSFLSLDMSSNLSPNKRLLVIRYLVIIVIEQFL